MEVSYINISDLVGDSVIFINFVTASIRFCFSTSVKLFSSVSLFVLLVICLKIYSCVWFFASIVPIFESIIVRNLQPIKFKRSFLS